MAPPTLRRKCLGINPKLFGKARANGLSIEASMLYSGYAASTAKKGRKKLNAACLLEEQKALAKKVEELRTTGLALSAEQQQQLVRGRLVTNVALGVDDGAQSAKLLGSDKRVAMWQPESVSGVIIVQTPQGQPLPCLPELPTDETPLLEATALTGDK